MASYFATTTELLVDTSARALLLAALAAIVLRFWRRVGANFQHRAWTAVLWGMLLLPILAQLTPALSLLPSGWRWQPRPVIAQSSAAPEKTIPTEPNLSGEAAPITTSGEPLRATPPGDWAASPTAQPPAMVGGASDWAPAADEDAASSVQAGNITNDRGEHRAAAMPETSAVSWAGVITVLYLCGVALFMTRLALGYVAVRRLVRRATNIPAPPDCRARLATSDAVRVPVTVGLVRPVILLPPDWSGWSTALVSSVVAHEQAHVDRRDHLVLLASEVNLCLYWFHPVAWLLRRRLSALAEQCCDDAVIAAMHNRGDYARHLLEIASRLTDSPRRFVPLAISMARSSRVESRIAAILDEHRPLSGRIGRGGALALAAMVGPIVLLAAGLRAANPTPQEQPAAAAKESVAAAAPPNAQAEADKPTANGAKVSGLVVRESDESPAAGAEVRLVLADAEGINVGVRRTKTDERGQFSFEDVPAGTHRLLAVMEGLASRRERLRAIQVKVAGGQMPGPVTLKLSPAPSIKVHVTRQADGQPLAGALVRLMNTGWDEMTNAEGDVLLIGLTPEEWSVRAQAEGFAAESTEIKLRGTQRAELSFALVPGGKIHGTVKNQEGEPLAGFWVRVRRSGDVPDAVQTDDQGRFRFDFVPLGEPLEVIAGQSPYPDKSNTVTVPSDGDLGVDFVLERRPIGGSVQGLVTDQDGTPIAGASVANGWRRSRDRRETFTGATGRFTIDDVQSNGQRAFVVVRAKGSAPQAVEVKPGPADDPAEITVKLQSGHRIRGRVVDMADKPIAGAQVVYESEGHVGLGDIGGEGTTDAGGRFEFDSLPADCSFNVWAQGHSRIQEMKLPLDDRQEALIRLQPPAIIRGRVVNAATGDAVTKFRVRLAPSPERRPDDPRGGTLGRDVKGERFNNAEGQFEIDDLQSGPPLQVIVDADGFDSASVPRVVPRPADEAEAIEIKLGPLDPAQIGSFAGAVVDGQGQPKAGVQLRLLVYEGPDRPRINGWPIRFFDRNLPEGVQILSAVSAADGSFHFDGVRTDKNIELVWWGGGGAEGRKEHLENLPHAQRRAIRIELALPGAIAGKVNRKTYPNLAQIRIIPQGVGAIQDIDFQHDANKTEYALGNLAPGDYVVWVEGSDLLGEKPGRRVRILEAPRITVEAGKTTTLDLGFDIDPGPAATPQAVAKPPVPALPIDEPADEEAVLTGRVVDEQKKPVPAAAVHLPLGFAPGQPEPAHPLRTQTDASGQFSFRIRRGWLAPTGDRTSTPTIWAYAADHALAIRSIEDVLLERPPRSMELVLQRRTDTSLRIVDLQGKPVAGAQVEPWNFTILDAKDAIAPMDIRAIVHGTSDADGIVRLPAIDRSNLLGVQISAMGFGSQVARALDTLDTAAPTIQLRPVGRLELKVTGDAPEKLAGLRIVARTNEERGLARGQPDQPLPTDSWTSGVTDEKGEFIATDLAAGTAWLRVSVDSAMPLRPKVPPEVRVTAGQTTRVEIPLVKAQRVRGLVRTKADGKPVAGVQVAVNHSFAKKGPPVSEETRTDAEGRFEAYVLPGRVAANVISKLPTLMPEERERRQEEEIAAQDGIVELKPIEMIASKTISGRLLDQFNHPLEGVSVRVIPNSNGGWAWTDTASDGSFSLQAPADADVEPSYKVVGRRIPFVDAEVIQRDPLVLRVRIAPQAKKP